MNIKSLVRRNREDLPATRRPENDLFSLQRDVNRLFDEFFGDFGLAPFRSLEERLPSFSPRVDVSETDAEVKVTAELPGLDEKDIEVTLEDEALTIKGEKKDEREEKTEQSYHIERTYGSFHRVIPLPAQVETGKVKAGFKKGVLTITLPKTAPQKASGRKIEIRAE